MGVHVANIALSRVESQALGVPVAAGDAGVGFLPTSERANERTSESRIIESVAGSVGRVGRGQSSRTGLQ